MLPALSVNFGLIVLTPSEVPLMVISVIVNAVPAVIGAAKVNLLPSLSPPVTAALAIPLTSVQLVKSISIMPDKSAVGVKVRSTKVFPV